MEKFFNVKTVEEVLDLTADFRPLEAEVVALAAAHRRVLARDQAAESDVPEFERSSMDGYAVRARDTFGVSETLPGLFQVIGEVPMGREADLAVGPSQAARVWTGGMIPEGADAVVMVEYARQAGEGRVELARPVAPLENVIRRGEDVPAGRVLLPQGRRLRAQDLGLLAALGRDRVEVGRRPRAAVISTGDEVVPVDQEPGPGQVRDVNTYTLTALIDDCGGEPLLMGLVPDRADRLRQACLSGLEQADVVLLSGGSSVGVRDYTVEVFESIPGAEILVHGVSVSPGKPTIMARVGDQSLWGLPGHTVSAMITFDLFVRPLLARLSGRKEDPGWGGSVTARLARNVPSVHGREDYIRVRLEPSGDLPAAHPVLGKSGLISTMVRADGLIKVGLNREGLPAGSEVEVNLFR